MSTAKVRVSCLLTFALTASLAVSGSAQAPQSLGAFIRPIAATASDSQSSAGRTADKMIDGSGWSEEKQGTGIYIHTSDAFSDGNCMWNGAANSTLNFDLGKPYEVSGIYLWNYNEKNGYNSRAVKDVAISYSVDNSAFVPLGMFTFEMAPGKDDYRGETIPFGKAVKARYFRWEIKSNYRGGEMSGIAEVRFANAVVRYTPPISTTWNPKYTRTNHPKRPLGAPLPGAENLVFPDDSGIVNVTHPPYNAKGDGVTDDTHAIQKALDRNPDRGAIIYLPNGIYRISDTIRWPGNENQQRNTVLQGQSRDGAVLQLRDNCPGFESPRKPKACINTGHAPAQRFFNEIHNITVDTGIGNPGACGIQFIANNQGGMYDVAIVSGDGHGVNGLDLGYTNEQGPCLIKNVHVTGFDVGIYSANGVASEVLEHIYLQHQNKYGMRNDGQPCTVRGLLSENDVPAYKNSSGFQVLIDCMFTGNGSALAIPAFTNSSSLFARDVSTTGYHAALEDFSGKVKNVRGPNVQQYLSKSSTSLFGSPTNGLNLPIKETPQIRRDPLDEWISPLTFGVGPDAERDASDAIQKAIDSGKSTVYLPRGGYHIGKTIIIRGKVRRLVGLKAYLIPSFGLLKQSEPLFRFADGAEPVVSVEGLITDYSVGPYCFIEHNSKRSLVIARLGINFQGETRAYRTGPSGTGDLYIEDVVGHSFLFRNQKVWARQFNVEGDGVHVENDGGIVWILGYKTEGGGTLVKTVGGGKTEIIGGFSYTVGKITDDPMFLIDNSEASISFSETCFTGTPFPLIVREIRNGETREMRQSDPRWGGYFSLFTSSGPRH